MPSYQDIETRLRTVEDKLNFVMQFFMVGNANQPFASPKSLLQVYREMKTGLILPASMKSEPFLDPTAVADAVVTEENAHARVDESRYPSEDATDDILL